MDNSLVNFKEIDEMLDGDPEAMKEFYEAAIISFSEFCEDYKTCMRERDLEGLRKVGHRIKPAAQMLGLNQVNEKYNESKQLLSEGRSDGDIKARVEEVDTLCDHIIGDFKEKLDQLEQ